MDMWSQLSQERRALADAMDTFTPEDWDTPSQCSEWSVRELVAHMTATSHMSVGKFLGSFIGSGFSVNKVIAKGTAEFSTNRSDKEIAANYRATIDARSGPPGPKVTLLGEVLIHSEDILRPLGRSMEHTDGATTAVLDFYKGSNMIIGAKKRISGVRLIATDTDWSHGEGPDVTGPAISLLLAATGRRSALDQLSGDGVAVLTSQFS